MTSIYTTEDLLKNTNKLKSIKKIQFESSNKIINELRSRIEILEKKLEFKNENESKIKKAKKRTCELLEVSTAHGIPNIIRAKRMLPIIMWSVLTILSTCVGSYYVMDNIFDYFKYSTVTSVDIIDEQQSEFPAITICADPSFNTSIDETILKVKFDNIDKYNFSHIFDQYEDSIFGKCFRFNTGKNIYNESIEILNSTKSGKTNGLKINLKFQFPSDYDYGDLLVFIHNKSSPPFSINDGGIWISTGSLNYFEINRIFYSKLSSPYNDCLKNVSLFKSNKELINYILRSNRLYAQSDCYHLCSHLFALKESNCNCNSTLNNFDMDCLPKYYNKTDTNITSCIKEYLKEFRIKYQIEKCSEYCPLECDIWMYTLNNFPEQLPSKGIIGEKSSNLNSLENFQQYEDVNKHFVAIRIYYTNLKYTFINQEIKTYIFTLVSNIGGLLGVFLGISFLSFI